MRVVLGIIAIFSFGSAYVQCDTQSDAPQSSSEEAIHDNQSCNCQNYWLGPLLVGMLGAILIVDLGMVSKRMRDTIQDLKVAITDLKRELSALQQPGVFRRRHRRRRPPAKTLPPTLPLSEGLGTITGSSGEEFEANLEAALATRDVHTG